MNSVTWRIFWDFETFDKDCGALEFQTITIEWVAFKCFQMFSKPYFQRQNRFQSERQLQQAAYGS